MRTKNAFQAFSVRSSERELVWTNRNGKLDYKRINCIGENRRKSIGEKRTAITSEKMEFSKLFIAVLIKNYFLLYRRKSSKFCFKKLVEYPLLLTSYYFYFLEILIERERITLLNFSTCKQKSYLSFKIMFLFISSPLWVSMTLIPKITARYKVFYEMLFSIFS